MTWKSAAKKNSSIDRVPGKLSRSWAWASERDGLAMGYRRGTIAALILLAMLIFGVISRIELAALPNVKPLAAMALFAAFYLRNAWMPCLALLAVMLVSDSVLGTYNWQVATSVYLGLMISCWLGSRVGQRDRHFQSGDQVARVGQAGWRLVIASIGMSTSFFLLTNGAVWLAGQWYPPTLSGLMNCYIAGIPFYRLTLLGDLAFTAGGLAIWQTAAVWNARRAAVIAAAPLALCKNS